MFIKQVLRSLYHKYSTSTNSLFCRYLKSKGIRMGTNVFFRYPNHTKIDLSRPSLVSFGSNIDINDNFTILTHDFATFVFRGLYHDFVPSSGKVVIGNNVVFGMNVTILKGVTIGDNCIIGLGSVITKDIPSNSVASGAPAKVVCSIHDYYLRRKQQSVIESFDYVSSIVESKKRKPIITDFTEEWALFFRQSDFDTYPEMHVLSIGD
jgi:acetyltransferase-like isoleucine patch superfamily enzyme